MQSWRPCKKERDRHARERNPMNLLSTLLQREQEKVSNNPRKILRQRWLLKRDPPAPRVPKRLSPRVKRHQLLKRRRDQLARLRRQRRRQAYPRVVVKSPGIAATLWRESSDIFTMVQNLRQKNKCCQQKVVTYDLDLQTLHVFRTFLRWCHSSLVWMIKTYRMESPQSRPYRFLKARTEVLHFLTN